LADNELEIQVVRGINVAAAKEADTYCK